MRLKTETLFPHCSDVQLYARAAGRAKAPKSWLGPKFSRSFTSAFIFVPSWYALTYTVKFHIFEIKFNFEKLTRCSQLINIKMQSVCIVLLCRYA